MVALTGSYSIWVVVLSLIIAFFTSYQAFNFSKKVTSHSEKMTWVWLIIASVVMGIGIWTMHFVGMVAFHLPIPLQYDIGKIVGAILTSIVASFTAFYLISIQTTQLRLILSSVCMTIAIVMMHYIGMSSMQNGIVTITYDPVLAALSVLIAFLSSYAALSLFVKIKTIDSEIILRSLAALLIATAVTGMHYVGMEASSFWCNDPAYINERFMTSTPTELLVALFLAIVVIILLTWLTQIWEQLMYKKMAYTDSLTGLNNRHAMNSFFKNPMLFQKKFATLFIDLDQFKYINDTLGHDVGDLLIQEMGARLSRHGGSSQHVFRIGGDEFMIIMPYEQKSEVIASVKQLLEEIRTPFLLGDHQLEVTGSIGISYSMVHGNTKDSLLKAADTAMYYAKNLGKNQYCEYNEDMERKVIRKMEIEKGLRDALIKNTLRLHYQPKWDIARNRPVGFEALLRYRHSNLGEIAPDEFIPIAEETGLILPITEWVLNRACHDCYEWNQEFKEALVVSVNLSRKLIDSSLLQNMLEQALESSGLRPELLELEITEQTMIQCGANITEQIVPLQQLGIKLSMDNFGSGYSFLGSLERLQFQTIKIDKGYIEHYELPTKRAIVNSVINLANQLNVQLIAEGVETESQLKFLQDAGCHLMQGYYFKKPMPVHEVNKWLKQI